MRITNQMMWMSSLRNLQANLAALSHAQDVATSGKKLQIASDNPPDASEVMNINSLLSDIDQYQKNAQSATTRLSTENVTLQSAVSLLNQVSELSLATQSAPVGDPTRVTAINQIAQIKSQLVALGNTQVGDVYIFGGSLTSTPPFQSDGTYVGDSNAQKVQLEQGVQMDVNHTGDTVFTPVFQALDALTAQLQSGSSGQIAAAVTAFSSAKEQLLATQSDAGARVQTIQTTTTELGQRTQTLLDRRSALTDADPTESVLDVTSAQNALEQAYAVTGKVLSTNLLDYLNTLR